MSDNGSHGYVKEGRSKGEEPNIAGLWRQHNLPHCIPPTSGSQRLADGFLGFRFPISGRRRTILVAVPGTAETENISKFGNPCPPNICETVTSEVVPSFFPAYMT
ncbi:hypothetical protein Y032_0019g3935 [Ancylostoma ceylanicum]|uniref:Uncharacterized protein n=1 Tax=Ancylostoma ceylanicum TaxID=53326 RepID=A0A016V4I4_9BILA|nr:hypothetical protein Y032_0019g3935 [Ancylostoma ceylanicum]